MSFDVFFGFNTADPDDRRWIARLTNYRQGRATGVPIDLVKRVKRAKVGQIFVIPLANAMTPGQAYDAGQLAGFLGAGWTKKRVAAKFNVLGRPEKRFGARVFQRPSPGQYVLSQQMIDAIKNPTI